MNILTEKRIILLGILILYLSGSKLFAQAGNLDSAFGNSGIASYWPGGGSSIAIQSDGKILEGGNSGNIDYSIVRFNLDGSVDASFGNAGITSTTIGFGYDSPRGITLQADGKILFCGSCVDFNGKASFALIRFNIDGTVDNSLNGNGKIITSFNSMGYADYGGAVTVQPDGKIIEVGMGQDNSAVDHFAAVRFNSDGSLDNTFGNGGKVLTLIGNPYPEATCVTVQPDGKILVGGLSHSGVAPSSFALIRYNADGSLDQSFGTGGKDTTYFGAVDQRNAGLAIALQPDGRILMTGSCFISGNSYASIPMVRYNADGSLDYSFGNNGKVITVNEDYGYLAKSIAIQQDAKILIAGSVSYNSGGTINDFLLARYTSTGVLDTTFGINGFVITSIDSTADNASSIALQPDGKILLGGWSSLGWTIARYLSGLNVGVLDLAINDLPILIYPNPIQSEATLQYTLANEECITISLYNMQGSRVQTFITNETRNTGEHKQVLDFNEALPSGEYILSISNGTNQQGIKVTVIR